MFHDLVTPGFALGPGVWTNTYNPAPKYTVAQTPNRRPRLHLARLKIISDIAAAQTLISQINTTYTQASAVAMAQAGLTSTNAAIQDILTAVFANQTAPANSRDQVGLRVNGAHEALRTITDPRVNCYGRCGVGEAAHYCGEGNKVVSECK
ncbi:hypothetical protein C8F04DRAFT_1178975 [Mycena alexandri]|uniref:Uncharacterized protein n=1 Tax=Mycena alexandri TaxID=1745969 RepID=A0AAD6X8L8_9AGAR|nr:hypothetical protein C8F04DRAFT_1178975 [Mycena alexandri]